MKSLQEGLIYTPEYIYLIKLLSEYIHADEVVGVSPVRSLDPDILAGDMYVMSCGRYNATNMY